MTVVVYDGGWQHLYGDKCLVDIPWCMTVAGWM